jgi:DNA-binding transcriptional LysR family regulator
VLVTSRDHALARQTSVAFSQVLGEAFVGLDRTSALQRFLAGRAAREGRRVRLRVQLHSFDGVCRMVEAGVGVGVGIVPETTANRAARTMEIATVPLRDAWALRDLRICVRAHASLSIRARQLVDQMVAKMADVASE